MSTTLLPPSEYVIEPEGQRPRAYRTVGGLAAAIVMIGDTPGRVSVRTGGRHRRLTELERQELRRQLRAYRRAAQADVAPAPAKPHQQAA